MLALVSLVCSSPSRHGMPDTNAHLWVQGSKRVVVSKESSLRASTPLGSRQSHSSVLLHIADMADEVSGMHQSASA